MELGEPDPTKDELASAIHVDEAEADQESCQGSATDQDQDRTGAQLHVRDITMPGDATGGGLTLSDLV